MSAQILRMPALDIAAARHLVAYPDLHDDGAVLDACDMLEARGDWIDNERARALRAVLVREAIDRINRRGRMRRKLKLLALISGDVLGALSLFGLLYLFLLFTPT